MYFKRFFVPVLIGLLFMTGCGYPTSTDKIEVAASISPLADFTSRVGGDQVEVRTLVPPGSNPHTYELNPEQMRFLSRAQLLVLNGAGLEYWAPSAVKSVSNPDLKVVKTSDGIELLASGHDSSHSHKNGNPHVWLDPLLAVHQVEKIAEALSEIDPDNADFYAENANDFKNDLENLHREIEQEIANWQHRSFVVQHSAWDYFARRYELEVAAVIEESPGREPSLQEMKQMVDIVREKDVKAVFAEYQFSPKLSEVIALETEAGVGQLDPLGGKTRLGYIELMHYNIEVMAQLLYGE